MGRHADLPSPRRSWVPPAIALAAALAVTAVLVPVLGRDDRSDAGSPAAATAPARADGELTLAVGGSVTFAGRTLALLDDPAGPFPGVRDTLDSADLALVDLPGPLPGPAAADALRAAGVDLVAVTGSPDATATAGTLDLLGAAGLRPVGAGRDATAAGTPQRTEVDGQGVTVAALSLAPGTTAAGPTTAGLAAADQVEAVLAAVGVAARRGDLVVVRLSGSQPCAPDTLDVTRRLVEAGVGVVLGAGDVAAGSWSSAGDQRAWLAPTPGPVLSAEDVPAASGLLRLTVRDGAVVAAALDATALDAFGRAAGVTQTSTTGSDPESPPTPACGGGADPDATP